MAPIWIVLANEGRARIVEWRSAGSDVQQVEELVDDAARADNADLRRDAHGRRNSGGTGLAGNTTESAGEDKLDHEAELFARRVADHLLQARRAQRYTQLRIAAAPRFLGRLRKQLHAEVTSTLIDQIDKDLLQLDRRTLTQRLFPAESGTG